MAIAAYPALDGYWPFDGGINDLSGNGNHAVGGLDTTGRFGNARRVVANTAPYLTVPYASSLDSYSTMTVSLWYRPESFSGSPADECVLYAGSAYSIWHTPASSQSSINFGGIGVVGPNIPVDGNWYHLTVVYRGTNAQFYIHNQAGTLLSSNRVNAAGGIVDVASGQAVEFGAHSSWHRITGSFDDVGYFRRPLTEAEIEYLVKQPLSTDRNGNANWDFFEDLDADGLTTPNDPDADGDGILNLVEDPNQDGLIAGDSNNDRIHGPGEVWTETDPLNADGDADGDGIPDRIEDADHDGRIAGDSNNNRIFDTGETWTETDPLRAEYSGPMGVAVRGMGNNYFLLDSAKIYSQSQLAYDWQCFLTNHPSYLGVRWKFNQTPLSAVTDSDTFIYKTTTTLLRTCTNAGSWYFHVVPVAATGLVDTNWLTHVRVNYNSAPPPVASATHPNTNFWYPNPIVNLSWSPGHGDTSSVVRAFYVWDGSPDTTPGTNDPGTTVYSLGLFEPANGVHYFHLRLQDRAGFLSEPAHFRVNIGEGSGIPPVADFVADVTNGVGPLTVHFTDLSTGDISSWAWDFNNDGVVDDTSPNPQPVFYSAGSWTVRLSVSGPAASDARTRTNYIVVTPPPPVADFTGSPTSGYPPLEVTFTDQTSGNITNRWWDFNGDGVNDATNPPAPIRFTYSLAGSFSPVLTVAGPGGITSLRRTNHIQASQLPAAPVADFSGTPRGGVAPLQVTFTDLSSGSISNRLWDFDNDGVTDATNPAPPIRFTYTNGGAFSVKLVVSGVGGSDPEIKPGYVTLSNTPPVVAVAAQQIYLNNLGDLATLDASPSSDADGDRLFYSWREYYQNPHQGLIPIGSDSLPKLNLYFPSPGRYQFDVRVSDGRDVSVDTRSITVYVPGRKGFVGFSPSDSVVRVADARLRVHNTSTEAQNNQNPVDIMLSDSLGRFYLENVEPQSSTLARTYWYRVERPGFVTSDVLSMTVRPDPGFGDDRQDEPIGRGTVTNMTGTIRNTNGVALQGAYATLIPGIGTTTFSDDTDLNGAFQLNNVPKGTWILQLRADGHQPEVRDINVADGMSALQFRLTPTSQTGNLAGRVFLAGTDRGIPNVRIMLGTGAETFSDASGNYQFAGIPTGDYLLLATKTGYEPLRLITARVRGGAATLDLPMAYTRSGPTVFGEVTDWISGRPVRLSTVGIESTGGLLVRSDVTDYTGFYQLVDVPTGLQRFRVSAPGYTPRVFTNEVTGSLIINISLERGPNWREVTPPPLGGPVARVVQPFIYLASMLQSATLDASSSSGSSLRYLWRENPNNPVLNRLPAGAETMSQIQLSGFSKPGIYIFELQVKSGNVVSPNTAAITVFAPGLAGNVHASPSDGVMGLNLATVRAYNNFTDANNWVVNGNMLASVQTLDNPAGNFAFDSLAPGTYWVAARAQSGTGFNPYGPVKRRVNYSSAARKTRINLPQDEFSFSGTITDATTGVPLENVRVVVAPGSLSESFRTTTDATGAFRLSYVPRGSAQLVMYVKEGYRMRISPIDINGNTVQNMTLSNNPSGQFANLSGHITADYQGVLLPVGNAEIVIGGGLARAVTDGSGFYQINNLPPGDCFGIVRKDGYVSQRLAPLAWFPLAAGSNILDKTLVFDDHGAVVRGLVMNEHQDPIPGVVIQVLPPPGGTSSRPEPGGPRPKSEEGPQSDSTGLFQIGDVAHGDQLLAITLPEGQTYTQTVHLEGNKELVWVAPYDKYDLWQSRVFSTDDAANPAVSGVAANPDGDRLPNLFEFVMGFDPQVPDSADGAQWVRRQGTNVWLGFRRAEGVSGVTYAVDTTTNLANPVWTTYPVAPVAVGTITNGIEAVEALVPNPGNPPKLFMRLRLTE